MGIHHAQERKAEKLGFTLTETNDEVAAFWPKRNTRVFGATAADAIKQMEAVQAMFEKDADLKVRHDAEFHRLVLVTRSDGRVNIVPLAPYEVASRWDDATAWRDEANEAAALATKGGDAGIQDGDGGDQQPVAEVQRSPSGIPLDGGVAYREGVVAGDNPHPEGSDAAEKWWEEWDAALDASDQPEDKKSGSVVSEKYRAKYAELGHPTHCGDWLAEFLNNQVLSKEGTDLDRFEAICAANGVDTSKYRRTGIGWQGRIRMTGRNLLAKKVYLAGGVLLVPAAEGDGFDEFRAPADWMASQRFKMPKAQQDQPIPQPEQQAA